MLDFYSDMNNARKEFDDKYVERTFIGEELDELDENEYRIEENKQQDMNESTTNILAELQSEDRQKEQQNQAQKE